MPKSRPTLLTAALTALLSVESSKIDYSIGEASCILSKRLSENFKLEIDTALPTAVLTALLSVELSRID